jgi:hypothetical protein
MLLNFEFRYFFSISLFLEEEIFSARVRSYTIREKFLRAEKVENTFTQLCVLIDMRTVRFKYFNELSSAQILFLFATFLFIFYLFFI